MGRASNRHRPGTRSLRVTTDAMRTPREAAIRVKSAVTSAAAAG